MRGTLGRVNLGFFSAFALITTGCLTFRPYDPGPGKRVAASVVEDTYVAGSPVNVTIANLSEVILYYPDGFCRTELQRRDGTVWIPVLNLSRRCPSELGFLDPNQAVVHQFRLPTGVASGTYRLAIPMPKPEDMTAHEADLLTPAFKVEGSVVSLTTRVD